MIKDGRITNYQFNDHIDKFNELLLRNLSLVTSNSNSGKSDAKFDIINNYKKELNLNTKIQKKVYILTRICISGFSLSSRLLIDFTISYDDFYMVPVLYFRVFKDSSISIKGNIDEAEVTPIMAIEEIISNYYSVLSLNTDLNLGPTVTLDSHHLIDDNSVWFYIHPCETLHTLKEFMESDNILLHCDNEQAQVLKYLCIWYATYGLGGIFPSISLRPSSQV